MKKQTYHVWTIREINQLKQMAEKMMTTKQAAEALNVPHFSVKNACHKYSIKFYNAGFFKRGHRAWNKGIKKPYKGGEATRFTKGHLPHNTRKDFDTRICRDKCGKDYKMIRISLGKWEYYHRYVWTLHYGHPGKNIIRFKDGNTMNCDIENLMLITRGENARLNTLTRKPRGKVKLVAY